MSSLQISGARVIDPGSGLDTVAFVGVRNGRIDYLDAQQPTQDYDQKIDVSGRWLLPGLVDLSAQLREPGNSHKATIRSELFAARAAGITSLCVGPQTRPVLDNASVLDWINQRVQAIGGCDVYALAALTEGLRGEALAELATLRDAGCVGATQLRHPMHNLQLVRRSLEYAHNFGVTVHVHPHDAGLANSGCVHEGPVATRLGLAGIPAAAETVAIAQWLELIEQTGARVHFCRLSCARSVRLVARAKSEGLPISADVAMHQLFLSEQNLGDFDPMMHVMPPLRSVEDRDALRAGVADGTIDAICSDHQPHEADAKTNPLPMTEAGISAMESLLPLGLQLVSDGVLSALQLSQRLCQAPAQILGVEAGTLQPGHTADLIVLDPTSQTTLDAQQMRSQGRNTPFLGHTMKGQVTHCLHRGHLVFEG